MPAAARQDTSYLDKINAEQELYVIDCGHGYTCLGFDVCLNRSRKIAAWLRQRGDKPPDILDDSRGTPGAYHIYCQLVSRAEVVCRENKIRCEVELTPALIGLEGKRVEVIDRHGEKRRFKVGKSTGWMPCHLELKTRASSGGIAVTGAPFKSVRIVG